MLCDILDVLGHESVSCGTPSAALDQIRSTDFRLVFSDFNMPEMNGREFREEALRIKPELGKRIVFVTGDQCNEDTQAFLNSTGVPFLEKPFPIAKVEDVIAETLALN